ncbi:hypothetical protein D9M72_550960 [compost metagenome]
MPHVEGVGQHQQSAEDQRHAEELPEVDRNPDVTGRIFGERRGVVVGAGRIRVLESGQQRHKDAGEEQRGGQAQLGAAEHAVVRGIVHGTWSLPSDRS